MDVLLEAPGGGELQAFYFLDCGLCKLGSDASHQQTEPFFQFTLLRWCVLVFEEKRGKRFIQRGKY